MKIIRVIYRIVRFFIFILPISGERKQIIIDFFTSNYRRSKVKSVGKNDSYSEYLTYLYESSNSKDDYVELSDEDFTRKEIDPKIFAYYLTQFSPCKQNDEWWGKGTTEWNNVSRAIPMYSGHHQPRLPGELGFYDLRIKDIFMRQVELAKKYGIFGFCFYYYWFDGKRLLEEGLDRYVNSNINFPFFLCWANESWTKRFDGTSREILMEQVHTEESYKKMIENASNYMKNDNYFKIDNKKVFSVYRVENMPNPKSVIKYWRDFCKENGVGDIYIIGILSSSKKINYIDQGFDAVTDFQLASVMNYVNDITSEYKVAHKEFEGQIIDYEDIVINKKYYKYDEKKLYRAVSPMWDNSARRYHKGLIAEKSSPRLYKTWLKDIIKYTKNRKDLDDSMIFINAWNEWGEGAYLEPDRKYGYAYLNATKEAIEETRE